MLIWSDLLFTFDQEDWQFNFTSIDVYVILDSNSSKIIDINYDVK